MPLEPANAVLERTRNLRLQTDAFEARPGGTLAFANVGLDIVRRGIGEQSQHAAMRWHRKDVDIARIALLDDIVDPAQQAAAAVWIEMFACKTQRAAAALLDQFARQRCEAAALPFGCGDQRPDMRIGLADDVMIEIGRAPV